jgi:DNA polymerase-3 subunit alpha
MQLAQKLGGYSLGEADLMRRAMGKKNREEMARHEEKFVSGAVERGIKEEKARQIFSLMAQFADYGFNRSHSVAYAYLAFQTAYLKAHYPEHFYAAVLSNETGDTAKILKYANELRGQDIRLLPPDVNESEAGFTPLRGSIRFGLEALKGVGEQSVATIIESRTAGGPFRSIFDFVERVGTGAVNKRVLESLVGAGAFDSMAPPAETLHTWRSKLFNAIEPVIAIASKALKARMQGQSGLFDVSSEVYVEPALPDAEPWSHTTLLANEKGSVGFYITGHPLDNYSEILAELKVMKSSDLSALGTGAKVRVGGMLSGVQVRTTKKGSRFGLMRLEDEESGVKCVVWPEAFTKFSHLVVEESAVLAEGRVEVTDDGAVTLVVDELAALGDFLQKRAKSLTVRLPQTQDVTGILEGLYKVCDGHRGECEILIEMFLPGEVLVRVRPHVALRVKGSIDLEKALGDLGCKVEWSQRNGMAV